MALNDVHLSAFDQGQAAGRNVSGPPLNNPFTVGSAEHNNFEVGRRFAAAHIENRGKPSAEAMEPDEDEQEN